MVLGNYFIELEPGNYQDEEDNYELDTQSEFLHFSQTGNIDCNIVNLVSYLERNTNPIDLEYRFLFCILTVPKDKRAWEQVVL